MQYRCFRAALLLVLIYLMLVLNLKAEEDASIKTHSIKIITTIFPLAEFAREVSGEWAEVSILLPPGAEVHSWRPKPSDIIRLSEADLFIYIGISMEPWIHEIMQSISSKDLIVLEVSKDLHIEEETHRHGHDQTTHDPHIWLDFGYDLMIIEKIVVALSRISPENSIHFHANARAYQEKLQILDRKYRTVLQRCRQRYLIIGGHAAFGYLTKRYNLQQVALYGISPDSKPTPRQLKEVIELGKKFDIKAIFFEEFIRDKLARIIAKELGAKTLILNPGSNLTREQIEAKLTFFDIMEQNLENLKNGLACQ